MDTFNNFFNTNNGKFVEYSDPTNKNQCMDLAFAWCDALDIPYTSIRHLYAYQVFTQPTSETLKYFDLIKNGWFNSPQVGDLVVIGNSVGIAGHISIATGKGSLMTYESFDQNWPIKSPCRLVTHKYDLRASGTLGWLRPKDACKAKLDQIQAILKASLSECDKVKSIKEALK